MYTDLESLTVMLYLLFDELVGFGRKGGVFVPSPFVLLAMARLDNEGCCEEGGVEASYNEFSVEDDFVVGAVPLDPSEPLVDFSV